MMDIAQFDYIFFIDEKALIGGDIQIFDKINYDLSKVFVTVARELNAYMDIPRDVEEERLAIKQKAKEVIKKIQGYTAEKKIRLLASDEKNADMHLIDILIKYYHSKNILIITNDAERAKRFLSMIPAFCAWGKELLVASYSNQLTPYIFDRKEEILDQLVASGLANDVLEKESEVVEKENEDIAADMDYKEGCIENNTVTEEVDQQTENVVQQKEVIEQQSDVEVEEKHDRNIDNLLDNQPVESKETVVDIEKEDANVINRVEEVVENEDKADLDFKEEKTNECLKNLEDEFDF